uniref:Lipase_3 domain-containing protein n=1 Tax=Strongyloides papillosus TaxID=174720 RepID=A0A0N5BXG7_STREA
MYTRKDFAVFFFALLIFLSVTNGEFTWHFRDFVLTKYDKEMLDSIERRDMGLGLIGSFGGKDDDSERIINKPAIFIHGTTIRAAIFLQSRKYFMDRGYKSGELYATTYGDGGLTSFFYKTMNCEDVINVRNFIKIVSEYTNSTVNVLGYSMGTPITRKAILGGKCVDTDEDLGEPITHLVDTYIALAGVGFGLETCNFLEDIYPSCNLVNGMHCKSKFLNNLNSQPTKFEGINTHAIYSDQDYLIGKDCCGNICPELNHANMTHKRNFNDHGTIVFNSLDLQYKLFTNIEEEESSSFIF